MLVATLGTRKKLGLFLGLPQQPRIRLDDPELLLLVMSAVRPVSYTRHRGPHRFESVHPDTGNIVVGESETHVTSALDTFLSNWFHQNQSAD